MSSKWCEKRLRKDQVLPHPYIFIVIQYNCNTDNDESESRIIGVYTERELAKQKAYKEAKRIYNSLEIENQMLVSVYSIYINRFSILKKTIKGPRPNVYLVEY